jgi:small conductance mechanosensitive channel
MTPFFKELKRLQTVGKKNLPIVVVGIALSAFFIMLGSYIHSWARKLWSRKIPNAFLAVTVAKLTVLPIWLMFFYVTLLTIGLQNLAATIIGGTGVLGIVLGFAFKGIAENYLSGLLLAIRSPFTKGDSIKVNEFEGIVQNLNMRGTTIMDNDGNLVLIPNTTVIQSVVLNKTANSIKRLSFTLNISYCDSAQRAVDLVKEVLDGFEEIQKEPLYSVFIERVETQGLFLRGYFWYDSKKSSDVRLRSHVIIKTKETLLSHGISFFDQTNVRVQMSREAREEKPNIQETAQKNLRDVDSTRSDPAEVEDLKKIAAAASLPTHHGTQNLLAN